MIRRGSPRLVQVAPGASAPPQNSGDGDAHQREACGSGPHLVYRAALHCGGCLADDRLARTNITAPSTRPPSGGLSRLLSPEKQDRVHELLELILESKDSTNLYSLYAELRELVRDLPLRGPNDPEQGPLIEMPETLARYWRKQQPIHRGAPMISIN
jgi:hypothetical protein